MNSMYNLGKLWGAVVGKSIKIIYQQLGLNSREWNQHFTKAGVPTTLRNLQRRSKDELWSENSPVDRSGRATYCSFLQWEMLLEGQQSVEFFRDLG